MSTQDIQVLPPPAADEEVAFSDANKLNNIKSFLRNQKRILPVFIILSTMIPFFLSFGKQFFVTS